jgi:hypothetical protein
MTNPDREELVKPRKHYFVPSDDDFDTCARCGKNIRNDEHCSNTERPETDAEYIDRLESALRRLASSDSGVKDTYLVGGADLKAMSGDIDSNRVIKLHFNRPTTDKDREWLLDAINLKIRSDQGTAPPADAGMREALERAFLLAADKAAAAGRAAARINVFGALREAYDAFETDMRRLARQISNGDEIRDTNGLIWLTAPGATTKSDGGWNEAIEACIQAVRQTGNFGDYKREELTADYGRPKFDMMNAIINALTALRSEALTKSDGGGESRPAHPGTGGRAPCIEQTTPATMPAQAGVAPGPSDPSPTRSDVTVESLARLYLRQRILNRARR